MNKVRAGFFGKVNRWVSEHQALVVLLLVVLVLRVPNLLEPYWYGDEGIYLIIGQGLRRGLRLYTEIMDHKTPMIYWMAAAAGNLYWFKYLLVISSLISISLFYFLANRLFRVKRALWVAVIGFALLTTLPAYEGNIVNGELMLMPFVLAGMYLFWKPLSPAKFGGSFSTAMKEKGSWWAIMIGAVFSLAILTKVPASFEVMALGLFMLASTIWGGARRYWRDGLVFLVWLGAGVLAPILLSIIYFYLQGTLQGYLDFGLLYNFRYIEAWSPPFDHALGVFLATFPGRMMLMAIGLLLAWRLTGRDVGGRFILIWGVLSLFAATLSLRPYPHYFLQVVPALSLAMGWLLQASWRVRVAAIIFIVGSFGLTFGLGMRTYPTVGYYANFFNYMTQKQSQEDYYAWFDSKTRDIYATGPMLRKLLKEDERLYIHGNEPMIYALADRSPATRYIVHFHVESLGAHEEVVADLRHNKPRYILDYYQSYDSFPQLYELLQRDYGLMGTVNRADVYRLQDQDL
jgi:4-amino-4-deoxy-L-arabinose transferase-like glycosyltransferase